MPEMSRVLWAKRGRQIKMRMEEVRTDQMVLGKILEVDISSVCYHKTKELGRGEEKQGF